MRRRFAFVAGAGLASIAGIVPTFAEMDTDGHSIQEVVDDDDTAFQGETQAIFGTGFTYQGRLLVNGMPPPASGPGSTIDFVFRLRDAVTGGATLGAPLFADDFTNFDEAGVFTVNLNFTTGFDGNERWLEVLVRDGASSGVYTTLSPRQPITPAPYALKSQAAFALDAADGNPARAVFVDNDGKVGIGTQAPGGKLTIQGSPGVPSLELLAPADATGSITVTSPSGDPGFVALADNGRRRDIRFDENAMQLLVSVDGASPTASNGVNILDTGNVGIGTTSPAHKLSVVGGIQSTTGGFVFPDGTTQTTAATDGVGFWNSSGTNIFNNNSGNVGIGTNAPSEELHILRNQASATRLRIENLNASAGASAGLSLFTPGEIPGQFVTSFITLDNAVDGGELNINSGLSDTRIFATELQIDGGLGGNISIIGRDNNEKVSVSGGVTDPSYGTISISNINDQEVAVITGGGNDDSGEIRLYRDGQAIETVEIRAEDGTGQGAGMILRRSDGTTGIFLNAEESVGRGADITLYNNSGTATVSIDADYDNTGVGRVITDVLEITGADLAEKFPASEAIEPGMLVAIDTQNEGQLCLARGAYNRTVAGVVSGANGFSVGAVLGNRLESEAGPPIALAGRVYVWVDADTAPVRPGDMLTTSETPGYAMRVQDQAAAQGAIIGKAMGSLDAGKGLVLVLVNLQ